MKYILLPLFLYSLNSFGQQIERDSTIIELQPISLKPYFTTQSSLQVSSSNHFITKDGIQNNSPISLSSAFNQVAGLRMEERSPGSYRIALRGSTTRSPFGIRNTKVYFDDMPFTDAGGNTYINLINPYALQSAHIIKGPDASLFAANSGGVIQLSPALDEHNTIDLSLSYGSYNQLQENISFTKNVNPHYRFSLHQQYITSEGYRDNAALERLSFQTSHQIKYTPKNTLNIHALYTDIGYQTPGGLTLAQYENSPKDARPRAGNTPGAKEQNAAIYNNTIYGGINNHYQINSSWKHFIAAFGSYTNLENPFITNYEIRKEKNAGVRTYISYNTENTSTPFEIQFGVESIKGWNNIENSDNNAGIAGNIQSSDDLNVSQTNIFSRIAKGITTSWFFEASLGWNYNTLQYKNIFSIQNAEQGEIKFDAVWMPRLATSYILTPQSSLRGSISKGYSTPTIAEIRASDNQINLELQPEEGINYEVGYKLRSQNGARMLDISAYSYKMKNGIVKQMDDTGNDYYRNAGEMDQKGVELAFWSIWPINKVIFNRLSFNTAISYNDYTFGDYVSGNTNFKGNKITSVPKWTMSNTLDIRFLGATKLTLTHYHMDDVPLNDANTVFSKKYDLVQLKISQEISIPRLKAKSLFYFYIDNLLDQKYSLGNDINAFGGRFFNAAAPRNYAIGMKISL